MENAFIPGVIFVFIQEGVNHWGMTNAALLRIEEIIKEGGTQSHVYSKSVIYTAERKMLWKRLKSKLK